MKKSLKDDSSKNRILQVSTKLFAQKGYDAVSVREISRLAKVNVAMISYFWGSKKELYNAIVENLITTQNNYVKTFLDFAINPEDLTKELQIELMYKTVDKTVDFFYGDISYELLTFILHGQKKNQVLSDLPLFQYATKLMAALLEKKESDKDVIFNMVFIISLITSPRMLSNFSLNLMGQYKFTKKDINYIRKNAKSYMTNLLKDKGII